MGVRSMQQGQAKLHPCHLAAQDGRAKDSLRGLVVEGSLQDGLQGVGVVGQAGERGVRGSARLLHHWLALVAASFHLPLAGVRRREESVTGGGLVQSRESVQGVSLVEGRDGEEDHDGSHAVPAAGGGQAGGREGDAGSLATLVGPSSTSRVRSKCWTWSRWKMPREGGRPRRGSAVGDSAALLPSQPSTRCLPATLPRTCWYRSSPCIGAFPSIGGYRTAFDPLLARHAAGQVMQSLPVVDESAALPSLATSSSSCTHRPVSKAR